MAYDGIPKLATWKTDTEVLRKSAGGSTLDKIDADIDSYHKAFSPMTKRNLLNDLRLRIRDWENMKGTTVSFHTNVKWLKEAIERKITELSPTAFKYRKAICLSFNIGCNEAGNYFRFSDKDGIDMNDKCQQMMRAITHAQSVVAASGVDSDDTLKIFMAPEFYFRGAKGAYPYSLVSQIIPAMRGFGTDSHLFQHWLFVFGTAIAAAENEITYCSTCGVYPNTVRFDRDPTSRMGEGGIRKKTQGVCTVDPTHPVVEGSFGADVQNVALIQKGADTHMVVKEFVSGIDHIGNTVDVDQGTRKKPTVYTMPAVAPHGSRQSGIASKYADERMGGGVFTMDGITFGMEICLDHIQSGGRLANHGNSIQILLIPSYGMQITHQPCMVGGIIFNVDGRVNGTSAVVVKGHVAPPIIGVATAAPNTRGAIEKWGPFDIPRRG